MKIDRTDVDKIRSYKIRMIVAGSRYWSDYSHFEKKLKGAVLAFKLSLLGEESLSEPLFKDVLIISGAALTGADRLAIDYAAFHDLDWVEFPAEWDKHPRKTAGMIRNREMSRAGNCLVSFWDMDSTGTFNMISLMIPCKENIVVPVKITA